MTMVAKTTSFAHLKVPLLGARVSATKTRAANLTLSSLISKKVHSDSSKSQLPRLDTIISLSMLRLCPWALQPLWAEALWPGDSIIYPRLIICARSRVQQAWKVISETGRIIWLIKSNNNRPPQLLPSIASETSSPALRHSNCSLRTAAPKLAALLPPRI